MVKQWLIKLQGNKFDLQDLSRLLCSPDLSVTEADNSYYLDSEEFNSVTEISEVYASATKLLEFINGSAKLDLKNFDAVSVVKVIRFDEDGQRESFVIAPPMRAKSRVRVRVCLSGEQISSRPPSVLESWTAIARQDERVAKALRIWHSREHNWHNLYNVYEVVEGNVGTMSKISKILQNGWATEPEIKLFKRTACNENVLGDEARHGDSGDKDLKNPMSLAEAESLIARILKKWLHSKCP